MDDRPEAANTLALLGASIGPDWRTRLGEPGWATGNRVAQCLLTGVNLAAWQCLAPRLPRPRVIAGYSVGELAAFSAAGLFSTTTALALATLRAELMDRCVLGLDTGLLAVTGATRASVDEACQRHGLSVAIDSGVDRLNLGGHAAALDAAAPQLLQHGARCERLAVRLASHTPLMLPAASAFALQLQGLAFGQARALLVGNRSGAALRGQDALRRALAEQIAHPVRWSACMDAIAQQRPSCVLEVGAGSALSALWNSRFPEIPARSIDEFRSPDGVVSWVSRKLASD